jgi:hypothetical protein
MLEDFTDTLVGLCGTFKILVGTNLLAHFLTLHTTMLVIIHNNCPMTSTRVQDMHESASKRIILEKAYLLRSNGLLACFVKLLDRLLVVAEIFLTTNENNGKPLAEMEDFGDPLEVGTCQQFAMTKVALPGKDKLCLTFS